MIFALIDFSDGSVNPFLISILRSILLIIIFSSLNL